MPAAVVGEVKMTASGSSEESVQSALTQFEVLMVRFLSEDNHEAFLQHVPAIVKDDAVAMKRLLELTSDDIQFSLRQIQNWLAVCSIEYLELFCSYTMALVNKHGTLGVNNKLQKKQLPSTTDAVDMSSNFSENSVDFLVIQTLVGVLRRGFKIKDGVPPTLTKLDVFALQFLYIRLNYVYSVPIRWIASEALALFSRCPTHLQSIVSMLSEDMAKLKKDDHFREFSTILRVTKHLDFGIGRDTVQTSCTLRYLGSLSEMMIRVERGVLRQEICDSLIHILFAIMRPGSRSSASTPDVTPLVPHRTNLLGPSSVGMSCGEHITYGAAVPGQDGIGCSVFSADTIEKNGDDSFVVAASKAAYRYLFSDSPENMKAHSNQRKAFWDTFNTIYLTVSKWSKKSKHTEFCYELMVAMVSLGNFVFFNSVGRDGGGVLSSTAGMLSLIAKGLKDNDLRFKCIELLRNLIRDISGDIIRGDPVGFSTSMSGLLSLILTSKAKKVPDEEVQLLSEVFLHIGRKHLYYSLDQMVPLISNGKFSNHYHLIAVMRALGSLSKDYPTEIMGKNYLLGPLLHPWLEQDEDLQLLQASIQCFPYIHYPNLETFRNMVKRVASLTVHNNTNIANAAARSLQEYLLFDVDENICEVLSTIVPVLTAAVELNHAMKCFNLIRLVLQTWIEKTVNDAKVNWAKLRAVKEELEVLCLVWYCHQEAFVRADAASMLGVFSSDAFRKLDKSKDNYIESCLLDVALRDLLKTVQSEQATPNDSEVSTWSLELELFLVDRYFDFKNQIGAAWVRILNLFFSEILGIGYQFDMFVNHLRFLCFGLRLPLPTPFFITDATIRQFFPALFSMIHTTNNASPAGIELFKCVTKFFDMPCRDEFLRHLVAWEQEHFALATVDKSRKGVSADATSVDDIWMNPELIIFVAELYASLSVDQFASFGPCLKSTLPTLAIMLMDPKSRLGAHIMTLDLRARSAAATIIRVFLEMPISERALIVTAPPSVSVLSGKHSEDQSGRRRSRSRSSSDTDSVTGGENRRLHGITRKAADKETHDRGRSKSTMISKSDALRRSNAVTVCDSASISQLGEVERIARRTGMVTSLLSWLPSTPENQAIEVYYKSVIDILRTLSCAVALSQLEEIELEKSFIAKLQPYLVSNNPEIVTNVVVCYRQFLLSHPHQLQSFIWRSFPDCFRSTELDRQKMKGAVPVITKEMEIAWETLAGHYLDVLVSCFHKRMHSWSNDFGCSVMRVVVVVLVHLNSPSSRLRNLALSLAASLTDPRYDDNIRLDSFSYLPFASHPDDIVFKRLPWRFSDSVGSAIKSPRRAAVAIDELMKIIPILSSETKSPLVRLMIPWVRNFALLFSPTGCLDYDLLSEILTSMFDLTRETMSMHDSLTELWCAAVTPLWNDEDSVMAASVAVVEIVQWLTKRYSIAALNGTIKPETDLITRLCRQVLLYISRASESAASLAVTTLSHSLRHYPEKGPRDPLVFLPYAANHHTASEALSSVEAAAVEMLADLVYEVPIAVSKSLPLLLQNAFVLEWSPRSVPCDLVSNLILSISESLITVDVRLVGRTLRKSIESANPSGNLLSLLSAGTVDDICEILSALNVNLRSEWCEIALQWALESTDPKIRISSFSILSILCKSGVVGVDQPFLIPLIPLLMAVSLDATKKKDDQTVVAISQIFHSVSRTAALSDTSESAVVLRSHLLNAGFSFMTTELVGLYQCGLNIVDAVLSTAELCDHKLPESSYVEDCLYSLSGVLTVASVDPIAISTRSKVVKKVTNTYECSNKQQSVSQIITELLLKGVCHVTTQQLALKLLNFCANACLIREGQENCVIIGTLLCHALMATSEPAPSRPDSYCNSAITYFKECDYPLSDFSLLFSQWMTDSVTKSAGASLDDFYNQFFSAFYSKFPDPESFRYALKIAMLLLHRGPSSGKVEIIRLINALLSSSKALWTVSQFKMITEAVMEYYYYRNKELCDAAITLMFSIVQRTEAISTGHHLDVDDSFDFYRKPKQWPPPSDLAKSRTSIDYFRATTNESIAVERQCCGLRLTELVNRASSKSVQVSEKYSKQNLNNEVDDAVARSISVDEEREERVEQAIHAVDESTIPEVNGGNIGLDIVSDNVDADARYTGSDSEEGSGDAKEMDVNDDGIGVAALI